MAELGFKVFGNEISFWSAEGDEEIKKSLERLDPKLRILEILSGKVSKNKKYIVLIFISDDNVIFFIMLHINFK